MKERGVVRVPGDKSISHRALILASLATGESLISGILDSADVRSTAGALRRLGVRIPELSSDFRVSGVGLHGLKAPSWVLDAGNSGTTVRLMAGVVAACPFDSKFEGDASLSRRPMKRIADPLTEMGARFTFANGSDGLPMTVHGGHLSPITWNTRAASGQTKSCILLAGLVAGVHVSVIEARKSRDHTERMLTSLGVPMTVDDVTASMWPVDHLSPLELVIPGDPSSAAYMIAIGVLQKTGEVRIPDVCMNETRIGFIETIMDMGGDIEVLDRKAIAGDDVATLVVRPSRLRNAKVGGGRIPSMIDELPLLACVAAGAGVSLEVHDADELRVKESDRIATVVSNLRIVGATATELPDGFIVSPGKKALSGAVTTEGDHRIAMSFGVLGALPGNSIDIDDRDCVAVSYPRFWTDLQAISRTG
ncbi:MAG TPA: 3-phosphoshikimate 1-carboxyvinyltransferase [Gemmatimonadaceae bacterium]|nr:3-phosphoshikimate 1-carboxyvinyltransferase [Gemmatimonadaceae bacterium]